jgi:hypothetical protein
VKANRPRTTTNTLGKLNRFFSTWFAEPLPTITVERIESWKIRRVNAGRVATTVTRDIYTLSGVLRRAVRTGKLVDNPVRWVGKPSIDRRPKIRYLDELEEARLRGSLYTRDAAAMREALESGNTWRQDRQQGCFHLCPERSGIPQRPSTVIWLVVREGLEPSTSAL